MAADRVPVARAKDHWDGLARQLREYMRQVNDERLTELYQKLYAEGWAEPRPRPASTRHADHELKHLIFDYISVEIIERREGKTPSVR